MTCWREKLVQWFGSDESATQKIDKLDQRQREIGHDINNIRMKLDPLEQLIRTLEQKEGNKNG